MLATPARAPQTPSETSTDDTLRAKFRRNLENAKRDGDTELQELWQKRLDALPPKQTSAANQLYAEADIQRTLAKLAADRDKVTTKASAKKAE